jgi:hypothetical protein
MMSALFDGLPALLLEIAEVVSEVTDPQTGLLSALAISKARGGERVRILPILEENDWLIEAVGISVAKTIVNFYTTEDKGEQIDIPIGSSRGYNQQRRNRRRIIEQGLASGQSIAEIARDAECTARYVFWLKARLKGATADTRQLKLFGDEAA